MAGNQCRIERIDVWRQSAGIVLDFCEVHPTAPMNEGPSDALAPVEAMIPARKGGGLTLGKAGQFLSGRKKSGRSRDSSLAGKPVSGSGILYVLRSRRAHR